MINIADAVIIEVRMYMTRLLRVEHAKIQYAKAPACDPKL